MSWIHEPEDYLDLLSRFKNDPRLPTNVRETINTAKLFDREFLRIIFRYYAYALRHPQQIHEPIVAIKRAIYLIIKNHMGKQRYYIYRVTTKWRNTFANIILEELYNDVKYYEKHSVSGNLKILNYWGNGLNKNQWYDGSSSD